MEGPADRLRMADARALLGVDGPGLGVYPIVTFQYSSTTLCHVSYHIQYLFF